MDSRIQQSKTQRVTGFAIFAIMTPLGILLGNEALSLTGQFNAIDAYF